MSLITKISSTLAISGFKAKLQGWIFKKKLLKFSGRYAWEPEACFYCPEMCRFSCPVAEARRDNTVTPRAKMSLLHLAERGFSDEQVAGSSEQRLWVLEQCSGCGRCTEYCVYENRVAMNLGKGRGEHFARQSLRAASQGREPDLIDLKAFNAMLDELTALKGVVLLCEPGRKQWWLDRPKLLGALGAESVCDAKLFQKEWMWGKLGPSQIEAVGDALSECTQLWVESPEAGWFLARAVKDELEALNAEIRVVWQRFFSEFSQLELPPGTSLHESFFLARHFPRLGYSIPMYERGLMPFHSGWNMLDCGGEGFYRLAHPATAATMGSRFLFDLSKDGRKVERLICQNLSCVEHLKGQTGAEVIYWLDELDRKAELR